VPITDPFCYELNAQHSNVHRNIPIRRLNLFVVFFEEFVVVVVQHFLPFLGLLSGVGTTVAVAVRVSLVCGGGKS